MGNECTIKDKHSGVVAAEGISIYKIYKKIHQFFLGSKAEMETLEDNYVSGSWRPSFLSPPPKRRKKSINK